MQATAEDGDARGPACSGKLKSNTSANRAQRIDRDHRGEPGGQAPSSSGAPVKGAR